MALETEREVLNHLIESCRDGERGFRNAADHLSDGQLRFVFLQLSAKRGQYAEELLPHAQRLGGPAAGDGTTVAALHRKWIDLKSALTHKSDHAVVVEAARGDGATVHAFKTALECSLPPDTREVVERQYQAIEEEHEWLAAVQAGHGVS
jgi:uncharacterized protein (TIGR02284 family)